MKRFITALILAMTAVTLGSGCRIFRDGYRSNSYRSESPSLEAPTTLGTPVATADYRPY